MKEEHKRKVETTYSWWHNNENMPNHINTNHIEELEAHAEKHINEMVGKGYLEGGLITEIDYIIYIGDWSRKYIHDKVEDEYTAYLELFKQGCTLKINECTLKGSVKYKKIGVKTEKGELLTYPLNYEGVKSLFTDLIFA
jgi:hypothetical protein